MVAIAVDGAKEEVEVATVVLTVEVSVPVVVAASVVVAGSETVSCYWGFVSDQYQSGISSSVVFTLH